MHRYDVFPQVVPADRESIIRIHPRFEHVKLKPTRQLQVVCAPWTGITRDGMLDAYRWGAKDGEPVRWETDGDDIILRHHFAGEQEHNIQLLISDRENPDFFENRSVRLYSLAPDLLALRPFKGDTHIHTTGSDGKEEPRYVAARYRQKGFDFIAVTDHRNYAPSLTARDFWAKRTPDFRIFPGEEVHAPDNPVHIVNFGGGSSVNAECFGDEAAYRREVAEIAAKLPEAMPERVRFVTASCRWVFDRIRAGGGLAIYAHPYWKMTRNVLPMPLVDAVFDDRKYDAVELLGGFYREEAEANNLQMLRCFEQWAKGNTFPVVGASDSHGTEVFPCNRAQVTDYIGRSTAVGADADLFNWYCTLVLAEDDAASSLISAIRQGRSAAVEAIPGGVPRIYGRERLARYFSFLLREYFPIHDPLCLAQGDAMIDLLAGDDGAERRLSLLHGRAAARREKFFAAC